MYESRILELIIISLSLRGFVKMFIHSIGDPINDFQPKEILSSYVSLISYFRFGLWDYPIAAWNRISDNLGYWKVFFCDLCINFWLSVILFAYICTLKEYIIILGINFLIIKIFK